LFSGSEASALALWNKALLCGDAINVQNLGYPFLGAGNNSNSVASTLIKCMGFSEPDLPGGHSTPGRGEMLLDNETIDQILQGGDAQPALSPIDVSNVSPALITSDYVEHDLDGDGDTDQRQLTQTFDDGLIIQAIGNLGTDGNLASVEVTETRSRSGSPIGSSRTVASADGTTGTQTINIEGTTVIYDLDDGGQATVSDVTAVEGHALSSQERSSLIIALNNTGVLPVDLLAPVF
jgi:hypothetical protein